MSKRSPTTAGKEAAMAAIAALKEEMALRKVDLLSPTKDDVVGLSLVGQIMCLRSAKLYARREEDVLPFKKLVFWTQRLKPLGEGEKPYYMSSPEFMEMMKKANEDPADYKKDEQVGEFLDAFRDTYFSSFGLMEGEDEDEDGGVTVETKESGEFVKVYNEAYNETAMTKGGDEDGGETVETDPTADAGGKTKMTPPVEEKKTLPGEE